MGTDLLAVEQKKGHVRRLKAYHPQLCGKQAFLSIQVFSRASIFCSFFDHASCQSFSRHCCNFRPIHQIVDNPFPLELCLRIVTELIDWMTLDVDQAISSQDDFRTLAQSSVIQAVVNTRDDLQSSRRQDSTEISGSTGPPELDEEVDIAGGATKREIL